MSTPRWMPRSAVALAAAALGTAGLGLAVVPSFAQESKVPPTEQPAPPLPDPDLKEGGDADKAPGPANGAREGGDRIENVAADLTLESARIESLNLNDTDQEYAVYHFGRVVHEISGPQGFILKGFNMDTRAAAADARLVQGDPTSVLVGFAPGTDLSRYTLASVDTGAVQDEAGEANLPGSVPLQGSTVAGSQNLTDGPDLTSVRAIHSLERVVYTYDEQIDEREGVDATSFGYYTADGKSVPATSLVTADDNSVTVGFDRQTEDGVLFWARQGAAQNLRGIESSPGSIGTSTSAPDLVSVSNVIGQSQWDYTFDAPVSTVAIDKFVVYAADGTAYRATGFARPSAEVVRIAIPEIHKFSANMALAAADEGAVKTSDRSEVASTLGSRHIGSTSAASGVSAGPWLTSVSMDDAVGQVRFVFDKPLDDDITYEAKNFMIMTPAGDLVRAQSMVEVTGNTILMNFDKNIVHAARGVVINDEAVADYQGQKSPARTIKI
ncbi:MAG TPA: hypothetical protein VFF24_09145 [Acidimicrobiia bacterium]|nr:hypothetical protein [Acidimicrobiia bacterium]